MASHPRPRVLCVDDDEEACEMLKVLVNSVGIDATCVRSAAEAWPQIKAKSFDLYLLDGWLPRTDGYEFCRQIREFDSNTPILFYSGAAYEADKRKGIAAGANAYVTKPDVEDLLETMLDLVAKFRADHVAARWVSNHLPPADESLSAQGFRVKTAAN
ncbi:MAG: response regulator [Acidobacteriota bacterium]|nr:response regulator [Acidobacteriota bacterium]